MNEWWLLSGFISLLIIACLIALYPLYKSRVSVLILAPIVFVFAVVMYWQWGGFQKWIKSIHKERRQQQVQAILQTLHDPKDVVETLKARLKLKPESARGWYLLGRVYASQHQWLKAHESFARAHQIKPDDIQVIVNDAMSLWQLNHQLFNDEIRDLFQSVLQKNQNQPDALAMLAMDAFLRHAYKPAIDYWQRLLTLVPPQSEEAKAIRKAIAKAQQNISK